MAAGDGPKTGGVAEALRVLCLEDSAADAELVLEELRGGGFDPVVDLAQDRAAFERLLDGQPYDVILADYNVPGLDPRAAVELAVATSPATPYICVSGTVGEEETVELLKLGADDVVLKDRMARLPFAVRRARAHKAHRLALEHSERRLRALIENLVHGYAFCRIVYDDRGRAVDAVYLDVNPAFGRLTGLADVVGKPISEVVPGAWESNPELLDLHARVAATGVPEAIELQLKPGDSWYSISAYSTEPGTYILVFDDVTEQHEVVSALRASTERLRRTVEGAVEAMGSMVAARDRYTAAHERRVTGLCMAIAWELGLDLAATTGLRFAALVHDIGKLTVPSEILSKPSTLNHLEFDLIKQHAVAGYEILGAIDFEYPVAEIVYQHHERLDGSGYPRGLADADIMEQARILAVADVVEAMASHRPYRAALGVEAALAEVRGGAGKRYDAAVVEACERVFAAGFEFGAE